MTIQIREYQPGDATVTAEIFRLAVRITASRDYSPAQILAWAPDDIDLDAWHQRRQAQHTFVAIEDGEVVGFTGLTSDGVLDMLFVDPPSGGRGIAKRLVAFALEHARQAGHEVVRTRSSRTARRVFEYSGFVVDAENHETRLHGENMPNFDMHIDLV